MGLNRLINIANVIATMHRDVPYTVRGPLAQKSARSAAIRRVTFECTGGTRFIGVYLARQLVEQGHEVTLLTRGKSPVTQQIPDDSDESFAKYQAAVKHIACDRKDAEAVKEKLSGAGFQGEPCCRSRSISP